MQEEKNTTGMTTPWRLRPGVKKFVDPFFCVVVSTSSSESTYSFIADKNGGMKGVAAATGGFIGVKCIGGAAE